MVGGELGPRVGYPQQENGRAESVGSSGLSPSVRVALEILPLPSSAQLAKAWCQPVCLLEKNILRVIMPLSRKLRVHPIEEAVVSKEGLWVGALA